MKLSASDIQRIAHLARIDLSPDELSPLRDKLASIFDMIDALSKVNTDNVTPMAHAQPVVSPLRQDKVMEPETEEQRDLYQKGAPAVSDGLFLVPKVIE
ncbi:MAG: Asp-tRNA(Asn)/Glu-tRNA(Gln) amidotransferase subunit GatC [Burkholderiales bacterium]|jgi:aspartyl-tRNA(Asn)/glutamyl-tRNA(Gln) amidotransferase subunit C|nr:Asp-tRNA(Asn)/Glu-tRNA(Gln) amidotransferase subunit GatC [Burkholderiales bacterium]